MDSILIERVRYIGDKYFYESPPLKEGINIIVGTNGSGKSTFMNFIYYCLSGTVNEFTPGNRESHSQVLNDTNNYIELEVLLNSSEKYIFRRYFRSNQITIIGGKEEVKVYPIFRSKNEPTIFSDWILEKLNIHIVEIYQGATNFKLNFRDLLRLVYHNQELNPQKIFKPSDSDNMIADSEMVRKIIFELLLGKTYSKYYETLSRFKESEKEKSVAKGLLDEYVVISKQLSQNKQDYNIVYLRERRLEVESMLLKLYLARNNFKENKTSDLASLNEITSVKAELIELELLQSGNSSKEIELLNELNKLDRLKENVILEATQIKKIIHTHEKLNLFSADSCPYCLKLVERKEGHCVCGNEIGEDQYEKFFYSGEEYIEILKSKQKTVETIEIAIHSCRKEYESLIDGNKALKERSQLLKDKIKSTITDVSGSIDINKLNEIDNKIVSLKEELGSIDQAIKVEEKRDQLERKHNLAIEKWEDLKTQIQILQAGAQADIRKKISEFNTIYDDLMKSALHDCRSARIAEDDYMPIIDNGAYREASATVPKRLMYYFTLLRLSLTDDEIKFPRFLLVDTPETAGVDSENLKNSIAQYTKVIDGFLNKKHQLILSSGYEKFPTTYEEYVFERLRDDDKLLKLKTI
ncbi:MAG: AAA family ATPase [Bacteroidetes bacterium]|nr:AAA family ATPase [Bacteroidota bacterium]